MNKNALIIGCGNIGGLYDFESDDITSHAKALFLANQFDLSFYDNNLTLSNKLADKYNGVCIQEISDELLAAADWISLCTPTDTHYMYLEKLLCLNNKFILCEKPVSYSFNEIEEISKSFKKSSSSVFVNYTRRFQPSYISLKKNFIDLFKLSRLKECSVDYCRGFINNASHAFDILEFLFDTPMQLKYINISKAEYDVFKSDPTVSLTAKWEDANIVANGHANVADFVFQIKLQFDFFSIEFLNSGNDIIIYNKSNKSDPVFQQRDCLKNYMQNVVSYMINNKNFNEKSNFASSLNLNKELLSYITS